VEPAPGRAPEIILWLVEDITYIGRVNLRRHLTDDLRKLGGNIGYDIRPSLRRRGYGTLICRLALDEARRHGLERALLTCDEDNPASRKIIEANGGVLEGGDVVNRPGILCLRFWIDL
jgi:predicted acetyltransferase